MIKLTFLILSSSFICTKSIYAQQFDNPDRIATAANVQKRSAIGLQLPTAKGSWMLGSSVLVGNMSFGGGSSSGNYTSYDISISPRVGYFITDNFAVGMTLNYTTARQTNAFSSSSFGSSLFARYYFGKSTDKDGDLRRTRFFLEAGAGLNGGRATLINPDGTRDRGSFSGYNAYVMPGVSYFINKNVSLEGSLYYQHNGSFTNDKFQNPAGVNKIGFNVGLNIFLGR